MPATTLEIIQDQTLDTTIELEELSHSEALKITQDLQSSVKLTYTTAVYAWQHRVWKTLGYGSWEEYLEKEIGEGAQLIIPASERAETIGAMINAQMSTRAISAVTGLSKSTVSRVVNEAKDSGIVDADATSMGRDGKVRKAPVKAEHKVTDHFPNDMLDTPIGDLGITAFTPKVANAESVPTIEPRSAKSTAESTPMPATNPGLVEVCESAQEFDELTTALIDANGRTRFDPGTVTGEMVHQVSRGVLVGAALLDLFNLQPDLFDTHKEFATILTSAVGTLDRVLEALES